MPVRRWFVVSVILIGVGLGTTRAATVDGLYEAQVPIADRSDAERARAQSAALARVLVKLTGNRASPATSSGSALLRSAGRYAQEFQYVGSAAPPGTSALELRVRFDQRGLDAAMSSAGLPIWGKERPRALLAVTVDDGGRRVGVSSADRTGLADAIYERAHGRGIPVALPRLDAEDIARLELAGTVGVAALAPRYQADAVARGEVSGSAAGPWRSRWTITIGDAETQWSGTGATGPETLQQGVDALADALAARYAAPLAGAGAESFDVAVHGVRSVADYALVQRYLDALDAVTTVQTRAVDGERVVFTVTVRGGGASLERVIGLGNVLAPMSGGGYQLRTP